jgi:hypothetical protein
VQRVEGVGEVEPVGDVGGDDERAVGVGGAVGDGLQAVATAAQQRDAAAGGDQRPRRRGADAAARAGDDGDPAVERVRGPAGREVRARVTSRRSAGGRP